MATLTPLSASLRAIPLPMPREDPVISACLVFWAMSTSLIAPSGVSGKGPSPRGNPGRNFGLGPLLAATMRRRVAVVNRDFRYGSMAAPHDGAHGAARPVGQPVKTPNTSMAVTLATLGDCALRRFRGWSLRLSRSE